VNNKSLVLDLVEWIARQSRSYVEVMGAWRTSCPRLPIWEDVQDLGFVQFQYRAGQSALVSVTDAGQAFLTSEGRIAQARTELLPRA
jgi:hypothetical protein